MSIKRSSMSTAGADDQQESTQQQCGVAAI
jgi:hypothetical protein